MRSTRRTILPSSVAGSPAPDEWRRMPSRTGAVRLSRSSSSTTRSECSLWRKPRPKRSRAQRSSTSSPMWPNGGWPRSCPSPIASVRSSLRPQRPRHRARDLRRLQRVGEPRAVVVALRRHEHLRLVLEPPERLAVHDPVAVALEGVAQRALLLGHEAVGGVLGGDHAPILATATAREARPRKVVTIPRARWRPARPRRARSARGRASRTRSRAPPCGRTRSTPGRRRARRRCRA